MSCGRTMGHGDSCCKGQECDSCRKIASLQRQLKKKDRGAKFIMEDGWDKKAVQELVERGLSHVHAKECVGVLAEHRQRAYMQGYNKCTEDNAVTIKKNVKLKREVRVLKKFFNAGDLTINDMAEIANILGMECRFDLEKLVGKPEDKED